MGEIGTITGLDDSSSGIVVNGLDIVSFQDAVD